MVQTVGVAPGTTTMQFSGTHVRAYDPYGTSLVDLREWNAGEFDRRWVPGLGANPIDTSAHIRWDLILGVGVGALVIALTAGLLATVGK